MRRAQVEGICRAQRLAREVILDVAQTVKAGDREREVAARIEAKLAAAKVHRWLHTAYAWFGERTRFGGFGNWESSALPSERRLAEGEPFILDVAPLIDGHPADFAYSGIAGGDDAAHRALLGELEGIKRDLVAWARDAASGSELCGRVDGAMRAAGREVIHTLYPAQVLGHSFDGFPNAFGALPRLGSGFQFPLLFSAAVGLIGHQLLGRPYPFLNDGAPGKPQGLFAVEPHLAQGAVGAKFESVLLIDGDETRWLDPGLFGEVVG